MNSTPPYIASFMYTTMPLSPHIGLTAIEKVLSAAITQEMSILESLCYVSIKVREWT